MHLAHMQQGKSLLVSHQQVVSYIPEAPASQFMVFSALQLGGSFLSPEVRRPRMRACACACTHMNAFRKAVDKQ